MIKYYIGNVFDAEQPIVAHQVNCSGVMGGGVAKQVKSLYPKCFEEYHALCRNYSDNEDRLMGYCLIYEDKLGKKIANLFGQMYIDGQKKITSYDAIYDALEKLFKYAKAHKEEVAIPYKMSCDSGGGDWNVLEAMIDSLSEKYGVTAHIYSLTTIPQKNNYICRCCK